VNHFLRPGDVFVDVGANIGLLGPFPLVSSNLALHGSSQEFGV
jgi:hypothetical protein